MRIIGCDLHARQQTVSMLDVDTGEVKELTLRHEGEQVREFYAALPRPVLVGIEATGSMGWFLELMEELGIECRVGHPADIRAADPRRQKHDRRDAALLCQMLAEDRFPKIWMPSREQQDLRSLVRHRHQWVRIRTQVQNALQAIALAHGLRLGSKLWSQAGQQALGGLCLAPYATQRRAELGQLQGWLRKGIGDLSHQVGEQANQRPGARLLLTHPGVGPITALATDVFLGEAARFANARALASYLGMIPSEHSSAGRRQRLGRLTKQGNPLLRFLWCEAVGHAVQVDPELRRFYRRTLQHRGLGIAKVAAARKLGVRLWIMLRDQIDYQEFCRRGQRRQSAVKPMRGCPSGTMVPKSGDC